MPAYTKKQQLINQLEKQIRSGAIAPGAKIPSAAELATQHDVSLMTVRGAVDHLKSLRLVEGVSGSGVYVRPKTDWLS